jgi:soluble P-type ATPase
MDRAQRATIVQYSSQVSIGNHQQKQKPELIAKVKSKGKTVVTITNSGNDHVGNRRYEAERG